MAIKNVRPTVRVTNKIQEKSGTHTETENEMCTHDDIH